LAGFRVARRNSGNSSIGYMESLLFLISSLSFRAPPGILITI